MGTASVLTHLHPLLCCIPDAIMGVSTFSDSTTGEFHRFDNAFVTMFRLTTDGTWPEAAPPFSEDRTVNWRGAAFSMSYIIIVNWVVLQVLV